MFRAFQYQFGNHTQNPAAAVGDTGVLRAGTATRRVRDDDVVTSGEAGPTNVHAADAAESLQ